MRWLVGILVVVLAGCDAGGGGRIDGAVNPGLDAGGGGGFDAGPGFDAGFDDCVGDPYEAVEAFAPVDIVWVVDTSGSMSDEAERVQMNMVAFAAAIEAVGIDWHVVMISTRDFVNVPASLATDPRYLLIDRAVNSNEPMAALLAEFPRYQDHLRRSALTHFIAVTDDESSVAWMDFSTQMRRLLGRNFVFHTISSEVAGPPSFMYPEGQPCSTGGGFPPEGAAAPGVQYYEMAMATGGRIFSICTPAAEWASLFDSLTAAIAVPMVIPCEYDIPEPPAGGELDYMRVNIRFTPSGGGEQVFPYVGSPDGADCTSGGWYYDDYAAPTRIILCPSTCSAISGDVGGRVDVELGCQTLLI